MRPASQIIILALVILTSMASAQAQSPREQLNQMVEQLQKTPTDNALREKIIKLAREVKPAPAVPEEAQRREGRAKFAFKSAKSNDDYLSAAREYEEAVRVAPWIPGYYSDLCTIYEKAEKYVDAKRNCEISMVGLSDPAQVSDIRQRVAGLEYGIEKANSPATKAATKTSRDEDLVRSLNGVRFDCPTQNNRAMGWGNDLWLVIEGNKIRTWTKVTWSDADLQRANPKDHTPGTIHDWGGKPIVGTRAGDGGGITNEIFEDRIVVTGYPSSPFSCPRKR